MPEDTLTEERKAKIDAMSHYDMCSTWRFASVANILPYVYINISVDLLPKYQRHLANRNI